MKPDSNPGSKHAYYSGFFLSISLTLVAFSLVDRHVNSGHMFLADNSVLLILGGLAVLQLFVQLAFFLHLDRESKPRWNSVVLAFAAIVVLILGFGSIWIMNNVNNHHYGYGSTHDGHQLDSPTQTNRYIIQDEGIKP
jgi:cytochrome o ubiquinol oxidase operon protein cyoD